VDRVALTTHVVGHRLLELDFPNGVAELAVHHLAVETFRDFFDLSAHYASVRDDIHMLLFY
jgi:hypothetical protein